MLSRGFRYISPTSWEIVYVCVNVVSTVGIYAFHPFTSPGNVKQSFRHMKPRPHFLKTNFLLRNKKSFTPL